MPLQGGARNYEQPHLRLTRIFSLFSLADSRLKVTSCLPCQQLPQPATCRVFSSSPSQIVCFSRSPEETSEAPETYVGAS